MLLDTSAWIEFFEGTGIGKKVGETLRSEECFTSIITIAEISEWCLRSNLEGKLEEYANSIERNSTIIDVNNLILKTAGKLNHIRKKSTERWGMIDSIIVATSLAYDMKVLTKDSHFKDLANAIILS